jgi:non-canonical (house-cleaning) NTP pyrophosphatase
MSNKLQFVVGSTNPVKVGCVAEAASLFWPGAVTIGVETDSGVSAQPRSDQEMLTGALNRAAQALEKYAATNADSSFGTSFGTSFGASFGVGIEGGVIDTADGMWAYAWVVVQGSDGRIGKGQTGRFLLPDPIAQLIRGGMELGEADDIFFGRENSKQREGAVGILSNGHITRHQLYQPAVTFALFRFIHQEFYLR